MKHLKTYKQNKNELRSEFQIGDYVLLKIKYGPDNFREFINNNIGQVVDLSTDFRSQVAPRKIPVTYEIRVKYNNVPDIIKDKFYKYNNREQPGWALTRLFTIDEIDISAKTLEDIKIKIDAKKYNL